MATGLCLCLPGLYLTDWMWLALPTLLSKVRFGSRRLVYRIFTARAARITMMVNEMVACAITSALAQRERTAVSVGESAVLVLKARKR